MSQTIRQTMARNGLYDLKTPILHARSSKLSFKHLLIWGSLRYIIRQPFYARKLMQIIEDKYGEQLHQFSIASFLKELEKVGYIERIRMINDTAQYQYKLTQKYDSFIEEETK